MGKIVSVISSARTKGSSDIIVNSIMSGAMGNSTNTFSLYYLHKMRAKGCMACMSCKSTGVCSMQDDINILMDDIIDADALIVSTPLYYGQSSWAYRMFEDRLYSFLDENGNSRIPPGKELIIVVTYSDDYEKAVALADHIENVMVSMYKFEIVGMIIYCDHGEKDHASKDENIKDAARRYGAMLNVSKPFKNTYLVSIPESDARRGGNDIPRGFKWTSR